MPEVISVWTDVSTAIVATAALFLSILSLVLQYRSWRYSGARIRVKAAQAFTLRGSSKKERILVVTVSNEGRGSTQITSWRLRPKGVGVSWTYDRQMLPKSDELPPVRLDGHHMFTWMVDWEAVEKDAEASQCTKFRPVVELGSGRKVLGRWHDMSKLENLED